ncbi:ATP-dependent RNA helicase DEAH13 [Senna tora]|uniref:RNA helicase n=1 Tax=Senna tora TaxID=362788 RepID=A0A834TT93_9FABA|nr:ATP-dependent RNA helicase DEAH13 [Senna tora]
MSSIEGEAPIVFLSATQWKSREFRNWLVFSEHNIMKVPAENIGGDIELNSQNGSLSLGDGGGDSNAVLLPAKTGKKRKGMNQVRGKIDSNKKQKLSNSQKKKLKKLEEEKEKELLLAKSIETLNKYKIPDYAYHLLQSVQNISRAETVLERRRRAVHLLKEGLEIGHSHDLSTKLSVPQRIEPETEEIHLAQEIEENDQIQATRSEIELSYTPSSPLEPSQEPTCGDEIVVNNGPLAASLGDVSVEKKATTVLDEIRYSPPTNGGIRAKPKDGTDETSKNNFSDLNDIKGFPAWRPSNTPTVVHVYRPAEVQEKRKDLPIVMMEQEIMEAINDHSTVIICGETGCAGYGSSKSEAHSGIIGVTQPRRVAVLATAKRVAYELDLHLGKEIGFQVRYDKKIGDNCSIKFMTDGILLREVQNDFLLKRYSVIILDEVHERSLNTDILIGMLSRVIRARQNVYNEQQEKMICGESIDPSQMIFPLKLVLMSATMRVQDFASERLFSPPPPVIEVPTRQFPVTVHFSKKTDIVDYIGQAYKKVMAIHKRLPPGGILVFVTGQREVEYLCRKLRSASRELVKKVSKASIENGCTVVQGTNSVEGVDMKEINEAFEIHGSSATQQTDRYSAYDEDEHDVYEDESDFSYNSETDSELEFDVDANTEHSENNGNLVNVLGQEGGSLALLKAAFEGLSEKKVPLNSNSEGEQTLSVNTEGVLDESQICREKKAGEDSGFSPGSLFVLPLYAMLPAAAQLRVFEGVKEGERLVVVATNVAETSLTIPGIKYVVDTGREKVKNYNSSNGMESYEVQWISKASAAQRAGRAGRTGPGHCYRLYSSAVFSNILPEFSLAEVSKVPIHGVVLLLKSMLIDEEVANFPFPTRPSDAALLEAEKCLIALEALRREKQREVYNRVIQQQEGKGLNRGTPKYKVRLTPLGKVMALYPLSPRHSRMLLTVIRFTRSMYKCKRPNLLLAYAVAAAAALSLSNPFVMHTEGNDSNGNLDMNEKSGMGDSDKVIDKEEKLRRKKLKEKAKAAREKFRVITSDALTSAYALQCFEHSKGSTEFCDDNALHYKTMEEMSKLRQQLLKLVFYHSNVGDLEQEYTWSHGTLEDVEQAWHVSSEKYSLSLDEERLICQAICAGWVDRVAKRITGSSRSSDGDTRVHVVRYQSCMYEESVFLHRWSSVSIAAPAFLVYNELLYTKRPYMHGVTSIEPAWLVEHAKSSCVFSPLTDPRPSYDNQTDQVKKWFVPTFGPFNWQLPKHQLPISDNDERMHVFAYALLEGQVCPCLKSVRKYMAAPPESILKPEALCQKRVVNLVEKLKSRLIDSSSKLRMVWKQNQKELFTEILGWFQKSFHKHFNELWLQMLSEVLQETKECSSITKVKKRLKGKSGKSCT